MDGFFALFTEYGFGEIAIMVLKIALIDLVLSGDNAAVIGLAVRHLPQTERKRAAMLGAFAALLLRIVFTIFAAMLLQVPYLSAIGAAILIFITYKLLSPHQEKQQTSTAKKNSLWSAIGVIVVADLSMAFDNVLAVAGAAAGEPALVILGLLLSIPLLIWGATLISGLMIKFPVILYAGGAVLLHTAIRMLVNDSALGLGQYIDPWGSLFAWGCALLLFLYGWNKTAKSRRS